MDRLRERLTLARRAVQTFAELALLPRPTTTERDAAIQRFEYSVEAVWKAAQRFLLVVEGVDVGSPKSAIRASREAGLLSPDQAEAALVMADDRNLTAQPTTRRWRSPSSVGSPDICARWRPGWRP